VHVLASLPALRAGAESVAVMAQSQNPAQPRRSMPLLPARSHPVPLDQGDERAANPGDRTFEQNLIARGAVPSRRCVRKVYPGLCSCALLLSMKMERHIKAHKEPRELSAGA